MQEPVPFDVLLKQVDRADTRVIGAIVRDYEVAEEPKETPLPEKRPMKPGIMHPAEASGWVPDRSVLSSWCWYLLMLSITGVLIWCYLFYGS